MVLALKPYGEKGSQVEALGYSQVGAVRVSQVEALRRRVGSRVRVLLDGQQSALPLCLSLLLTDGLADGAPLPLCSQDLAIRFPTYVYV